MDEDLSPKTEEQFHDVQTWKHMFIASFALLIFDWFITLDVEMEHVWQRQRSVFTYVWFALRYGPIVFMAITTYVFFQTSWEPKVCKPWSVIPTVMIFCVMLTVHIVFALRTYALYNRARWVFHILMFGLIAETGAMIWTATEELEMHLPKGYGCMPGTPRTVPGLVFWTAPFLFDIAVFGLTLYRSIQFIRSRKDIPIVQVMIRDGVVFFGLMVLSYGSNIVMYSLMPVGLQDVNATLSVILTVICTQRIVFNLRDMPTSSHSCPPDTTSMQSWHGAELLSNPSGLLDTVLTDIGEALERNHGHGQRCHAPPSEYYVHREVPLNDLSPVRTTVFQSHKSMQTTGTGDRLSDRPQDI
ncbi:hypothetical protein BKA62DRAFT_52381 [Auriculariales sp. MPI-PUGE-AT-0066]|nr:hypothetical protein BKA62DRAFT_52381 [Auriculariales sp. MPI-PUGE-AT-0066]